MPELPEVERVRLSLLAPLGGSRITSVDLRRPDIASAWTARATRPARPRDLLHRASITDLRRRGKQLAIIADDGRVMCVHLGMTGGLFIAPDRAAFADLNHVHVVWAIERDTPERHVHDPAW